MEFFHFIKATQKSGKEDAVIWFTSKTEARAVQVWGNGATYDNVLLEASYDRAGLPCPWKFWNDRDVRTIVELGKAVGCKPRYEIPSEGEPHKAISDALHQVKYVSAILQRLTEH